MNVEKPIRTIGQEIADLYDGSAFAKKDDLAKWIDTSINDAIRNAKLEEEKRIEKHIAMLPDNVISKMVSLCRFKNGVVL